MINSDFSIHKNTTYDLVNICYKITMILSQPEDLLTEDEIDFKAKFTKEFEKLKKVGNPFIKDSLEKQLQVILESIQKEIYIRRAN